MLRPRLVSTLALLLVLAALWPPLAGGPVHAFGESGGTAGELDGEGQESKDPGGVQGSQDPNGAQTPPAEG
jgi:hypothetical protein